MIVYIDFFGATAHPSPQWARASSFTRFLDHTQRRTTIGRTPPDEWSARRTDFYLTTHNTHNRNIHAPGWIRTHNLNRRAAADLRLRPCGHWEQYFDFYWCLKTSNFSPYGVQYKIIHLKIRIFYYKFGFPLAQGLNVLLKGPWIIRDCSIVHYEGKSWKYWGLNVPSNMCCALRRDRWGQPIKVPYTGWPTGTWHILNE